MTSISKHAMHPDWFMYQKDTPGLREALEAQKDSKVLKALLSALQRKLNVLNGEEQDCKYTSASWSHRQAHINGNKEIIAYVTTMLDFVRQD